MPDLKKLSTLTANSYRIITTCTNCVHGRFVSGSAWGSCAAINYQHLKHLAVKPVSVYETGACPKAQMRPTSLKQIESSGFDIFQTKKEI